MRKLFRRFGALCAAIPALFLLGVQVFAIPATGDGSGSMLPVMYGLILVGVVLVVVYILLLKKKRR